MVVFGQSPFGTTQFGGRYRDIAGVVTVDVTLNGGSLSVGVQTKNKKTPVSKYTTIENSGIQSVIVHIPEYQIGSVNDYNVHLKLNSSNPTKSPVVHSVSVDIPELPIDLTPTPKVTRATATPSNASVYAESSITPNTTTTTATPHKTSVEYSDKVVGTRKSEATTTTDVSGFAQTYDTPKTTTTVAQSNISYGFVNVFRDTNQTSATAIPHIADTAISKIGPYSEDIDANIEKVSDSWSNHAIPFGEGRNIYKLANALCAPLDGIDYRLNMVHANIHVSYAMGKSLDRIGNLANVTRKTGESDDHYRKRIIVHMRASVIGTTYDEVVSFTATLLDQPVDEVVVDLRPQTFPATLFILVNEDDVEHLPFNLQEIADLLDKVVPADHNVVLELQGTFLFKKIGEPDEPEHGFTTLPADETVGGSLSGEIGE